jgi:hypothetical protein
MSNITADMNTNNMNTAAKSSKKVAKKDSVTVTVTATPAPAVAEKPAAKAVAKKAAAPKAEAEVVAAPVAAPEAQAVAAAAPAVKSVNEEIVSLTSELNSVKEALRKSFVALKAIEKRHAAEIKEAKKRRRPKKEVDGEAKPARASVFTTPVILKDTLCTLLSKPKGTSMTPAECTRAVRGYITEHGLKGEKHAIKYDSRLFEVLGLAKEESLTYKNIQKYLYRLYEKKPVATA